MEKYILVKNYCMKCRLYPNKTQVTQIEALMRGAQAAYNMTLYKIAAEMKYTKEVDDKKGEGKVHFPDFNKAFSKEALDVIRHDNEYVNYLPGEAISSIKLGLIADMKKSWQETGSLPVEMWSKEEKRGPRFYSQRRPRTSFSYRTAVSNIETVDNKNVLRVKIGSKNYKVDGTVKVKGWNQRIRFGDEGQMDFREYIRSGQITRIPMRIEKELDMYFVVFSLTDIWKPFRVEENQLEHVGIDVGEITLASLSDGTKYKNIYDANPYYEHNTESIRQLNEQLSRKMGWKNIAFRETHKKDNTLEPSKSYMEADRRYKQLSARRSNRKNTYYHMVTSDIISKYKAIGVESLNVKDMYWYKESKNDQEGEDKQAKSTAQQKSERCFDVNVPVNTEVQV